MTTLDESMFDTEHGYEAQDAGPTVVRDGDVVDVAGAGAGGVSPAGRGGRRRGGSQQGGGEVGEGASGDGVSGDVDAVGGVPVEESAARMAPSRWVRETTFREKLRGYHQADVDSFLDQVAFAFDELEARLRDAEERAARAAGETAVTVADDETVRRTLTLAQRTAELAIAEAERQAAELVERARGESEGMVAAAEAEASAIRERERSKLMAELTHLESARAIAAEDLDELEQQRLREHQRLTSVLRDLAAAVEQRLA